MNATTLDARPRELPAALAAQLDRAMVDPLGAALVLAAGGDVGLSADWPRPLGELGIVEDRGGVLHVESELGRGTRFVVRLPRAA